MNVIPLSRDDAERQVDRANRLKRSDRGRKATFTSTLDETAAATFLDNDLRAAIAELDPPVASGQFARLLHPAGDRRILDQADLLQLLDFASGLVSVDDLELQPHGLRRYARLFRTQAVEAWVIAWASSNYLGLHDHGGSSAAYHIIAGTLYEASTSLSTRDPLVTRPLQARTRRSLTPNHVHELWNPSPTPALSVHVYSPPLHSMSFYADEASNYLTKFRTETEADWPDPKQWVERAIG